MEKIAADWTSLPEGVIAESLWVTLHDGYLNNIHSDLAAGAVTLSFQVGYVASFHNLPQDTRFLLKFESVISVRASAFYPWPSAPMIPQIATGRERLQLTAGYDPKWREQSVDWDALEKRLQNDEVRIDTSHAEIAQSEDQVGFRLEGTLLDDEDAYHYVFIHAACVSFSDTNGGMYDLDQFRELGGRYWEAFGKRAPDAAE
ncbi:MAG: hypothetical protein ABIY70_02920 [Capsulimonas sp.]|uniref:hypothetical protein n=1 Tax=Capsulimonas sp. TaxID=2494211 RepID=UPI003264D79A